MRFVFSKDFDRQLAKIKKLNPRLFEQVNKKICLLENNVNHASLRRHKLSGSMRQVWSVSINKSIRLLFIMIDKDNYYLIGVGKHEEVYK